MWCVLHSFALKEQRNYSKNIEFCGMYHTIVGYNVVCCISCRLWRILPVTCWDISPGLVGLTCRKPRCMLCLMRSSGKCCSGDCCSGSLADFGKEWRGKGEKGRKPRCMLWLIRSSGKCCSGDCSSGNLVDFGREWEGGGREREEAKVYTVVDEKFR